MSNFESSVMEYALANLINYDYAGYTGSRSRDLSLSCSNNNTFNSSNPSRRPQPITPLSEIWTNHSIMETLRSTSPSSPGPTPIFTSSPTKPGNSQNNHSRYKTEICRSFKEQGNCKYGEKCQFAHGAEELRTNNRHPKYKTEKCRTFHSVGYCPYGPRCHFIHGEDDEKLSEIRSNRGSRHPSGQSLTHFPSTSPKPILISESATGLTADFNPPSNMYRGAFSVFDDSSSDSFVSLNEVDHSMEMPPFLPLQNACSQLSLGHMSTSNRSTPCVNHNEMKQIFKSSQQALQSIRPSNQNGHTCIRQQPSNKYSQHVFRLIQ